MPTSPLEAEAIGQEFVTASYGGQEWLIPLDVDSWPAAVAATVRVEDGRVAVHYGHLAEALQELLGGQWPHFLAVAPKRKELVPASQAFAAAVGLPMADRLDVAFGAIPRLLRDLEQRPNDVELALHERGVDLRDRYRFTAGRRNLTLRKIAVLLYGKRELSDAAKAVMDLFEVMSGRPHPSRPLPPGEREKRESTAEKQERATAEYKKRRAPQKTSSVAQTAMANAQMRKEA